MRPAVVVHADWSVDPKKRWLALAIRQTDDSYVACAAQPVGALDGLLDGLRKMAHGGSVLLGFDFPIGLPAAYAAKAQLRDFKAALQEFDETFYTVAGSEHEIRLARPFYPMRPGGRRKQHLVDRLGLDCWCDLLRRCERRSTTRRAACALFWTLGGQQVGKAAITGWRFLLEPALRTRNDLALWPFDGRLDELLARYRFVVAETYPAEFYSHLKLSLKGGKRQRKVRKANTAPLLEWAKRAKVDLKPCLVDQIQNGFGADKRGDDRFDAVVGLFGMLNVVLGARVFEPADEKVRRIEGWILGQTA